MPQPLAAGEAWQWELQLLLWHLQPINRTCLHRKGKCSHCLRCFPEFWTESEGGNRDTAKSLPWALPLTRTGKRRGPCSFTLPKTPLSCLAHSRMGGTWVNARNSSTIFPRNSPRLGPLPSLPHVLRNGLIGLFDQSNLGTRGSYLSPCTVRKKIYRKKQVYPLNSWQIM